MMMMMMISLILGSALTFVGNIPRITFAFVVSDYVGDVVLHGSKQSCISPGAA